jgi:hypothetical protein
MIRCALFSMVIDGKPLEALVSRVSTRYAPGEAHLDESCKHGLAGKMQIRHGHG